MFLTIVSCAYSVAYARSEVVLIIYLAFNEDRDFEQSKNEIVLWTILTDLEEGKHAIAANTGLRR